MSLTGKDIAEIARLLDQSRFASLDLKRGDFRLRIRRDAGAPPRDFGEPEEAETPPAAATAPPPTDAPGPGEADVRAPLLGNFYITPRPGEPPYVEIGGRIEEETTIGIIEVMKLMNPVRAGVSGTVVAILAENGGPVEQGQPLIRVQVD